MRKNLFILLFICLVIGSNAGEPNNKPYTFPGSIKKNEGGKSFDENTHIINIGVGFGSRSYHSIYKVGGYSYGRTPAISLSYEQAYPKKLGPGYLGVGAYFGYQHEYYKYDYTYWWSNTYYYHHTWNHFMVAARAAYHWDVLNFANADVYGGVIAGLRFQLHSYSTNDPNNKDPYSYSNSVVYPAYSLFAGARWYFAKNFGVFAEAGYGISYLTGGLSIKF